MKRLMCAVLLLACLALSGCRVAEWLMDPVLSGLKPYKERIFRTSGGFQDFTDYAKYIYDDIPVEKLRGHDRLREMTAEDVAELNGYIDDFEGWVSATGLEGYDFDRLSVGEGDFMYIDDMEGKPIGQSAYEKYESYDVYFFDTQTDVLYFFHNNI